MPVSSLSATRRPDRKSDVSPVETEGGPTANPSTAGGSEPLRSTASAADMPSDVVDSRAKGPEKGSQELAPAIHLGKSSGGVPIREHGLTEAERMATYGAEVLGRLL